jgi:hypothetical protein
MAPMKRAAWTQSLTGLPFSRIAEAIIATAQAIAQRIRFVSRLFEELVISCFPCWLTFCTNNICAFSQHDDFWEKAIVSSHLKREIASQFYLKTI